MVLPAPNLDDRRFQDLVDDAKRLVQQRCPGWTDHNVSDPGVTLLETFAYVTDQLLYRLNRVPDRLYVTFLDMIGVRLLPPSAARSNVTFWLTGPRPDPVIVPRSTEVATVQADGGEAITFVTLADARALPTRVAHLATSAGGADAINQDRALQTGETCDAFSPTPVPADAFYVGLATAAPSCVVAIRFDCSVEGVGVDPADPPMVWEAWSGDRWLACDLERDETHALNKPGDVVLHVPPNHDITVVGGQAGGWLRARLTAPRPQQPFFAVPPKVRNVEAFTIGVDSDAVHAQLVEGERLGVSDGTPAQSLAVARTPVVPTGEPMVIQVARGGQWEDWSAVDSFASSGPEDRHVMVDSATGEVRFGPAVRLMNGGLRNYGAVPPAGAEIRVPWYWTGGGAGGNVGARRLQVVKAPVPNVAGATNRRAAFGGTDAEAIDNAKLRGPIELRTIDRAVTAEDYEVLVRRVAPEIARVRCVSNVDTEPGLVRVLLVPEVSGDPDQPLRLADLAPSPSTLQRLGAYLDDRRMLGTRLLLEPARYRGVTVVARVRAKRQVSAERLSAELVAALHRYLHPVVGGPDGTGWPFGRPVHQGEVYAVFQRVAGVDYVEQVRLFAVDLRAERPTDELERVVPEPTELIFSFRPDVLVEEAV